MHKLYFTAAGLLVPVLSMAQQSEIERIEIHLADIASSLRKIAEASDGQNKPSS